MNIFKKKIDTDNAVFNEDNVIKVKNRNINKKGISVKTAMIIVNIFTALLTLIAIVGIAYGVYYLLTDVVGLELSNLPIDLSGEEPSEPISENPLENSIAKEAYPVYG